MSECVLITRYIVPFYYDSRKTPFDELEKVSGGMNFDDDGNYDVCAGAPDGKHDWIIGANGKLTCRYCGIYIG